MRKIKWGLLELARVIIKLNYIYIVYLNSLYLLIDNTETEKIKLINYNYID